VDASAIGLTTAHANLAYQVTSCTGRFSGDVPGTFCDSAGAMDGTTGTWDLTFDATNPPLIVSPQVCRGFWGGGACNTAHPINVSVGSAAPGDTPSILAVFPNNPPARVPTVIGAET